MNSTDKKTENLTHEINLKLHENSQLIEELRKTVGQRMKNRPIMDCAVIVIGLNSALTEDMLELLSEEEKEGLLHLLHFIDTGLRSVRASPISTKNKKLH